MLIHAASTYTSALIKQVVDTVNALYAVIYVYLTIVLKLALLYFVYMHFNSKEMNMLLLNFRSSRHNMMLCKYLRKNTRYKIL